MSELDCDLIQSVIEHMNEDHADAVLVYVQAYAGRLSAESARLASIDRQGMKICYLEAGLYRDVTVGFDQTVSHAGEIRAELVRMAKEGREKLKC